MDRVAEALGCKMVCAVIPRDGAALKKMADRRNWRKLPAGKQAKRGCALLRARGCWRPLTLFPGDIDTPREPGLSRRAGHKMILSVVQTTHTGRLLDIHQQSSSIRASHMR